MITSAELWRRLEQHAGERFHQIRGATFTYAVDASGIHTDRTNWTIPRAQVEQALELVPLSNTVPVQHLFGPSYLYAILMDDRIRRTDW